VTQHIPQAAFDELLGSLHAELALLDGAVGMARTLRAQMEEYEAILERKRAASREMLRIMSKAQSLDPEHTPLPTKAGEALTKPKHSRPPAPRRAVPPPLPRKKNP
jgi:hypothetical protein